MKSYDYTKLPATPEDSIRAALMMGLHLCHVVCIERDDSMGDPVGGAFAMFVAWLPRVGELMQLENKREWRVKEVVHRVISRPGQPTTMIMDLPIIFCWPNEQAN